MGLVNLKNLRRSSRFATALACMLIFSCAKNNYNATQFSGPNVPQKVDPPKPPRPECEVKYYDIAMDLDLYSYEFVSSNGFSFGFSTSIENQWNVALDAEFKVDKSRLYMQVIPSNPYEQLPPVLAHANDKDVKFGVKIKFSDFALGYNHYKETPVAELTRKGLMKSLDAVAKKTLKKDYYKEWSTRVLRTPEDRPDKVIIQAGYDAGIKEGDRFAVYNIKHEWENENSPCEGDYYGFETTTNTPIAVLEATKSVNTSSQFATLTITDPNVTNAKIEPGAIVYQLPSADGKKPRQLARSVKINSIISGALMLKDNRQIDLVSFMYRQIDDVIQDKKWKGAFYRYKGN